MLLVPQIGEKFIERECFGEFGLFCGEFRKKFSSHTVFSSHRPPGRADNSLPYLCQKAPRSVLLKYIIVHSYNANVTYVGSSGMCPPSFPFVKCATCTTRHQTTTTTTNSLSLQSTLGLARGFLFRNLSRAFLPNATRAAPIGRCATRAARPLADDTSIYPLRPTGGVS